MKLISSFFFLFLIRCLAANAQLCFSPERPQIGQIVSFTYTPSATLVQDSTLEGRFVRYGAPTMMRISQPTTVTLVRQGSNYVGELYIPKKDVAGTMLFFRNSKLLHRTDLNNGQFYVVPVYDSTGRIIPHATGGQASVFTRSHFLNETGMRADPNWVVTLYEHELTMNPDLRSLYWADHLAALIKQRKPGYGPNVKAAIEAYLAARPSPTVAELADASRLYESMGDYQKVATLRERQKTTDPGGLLMQKDRAISIRNEADWGRKKAAYEAFLKDYPTSAHLPDLAAVMLNSYFKNNDIKGLIAFAEKQPTAQTDVLVLNTIANQLAEERRSLPEAEQLIKQALTVLNGQTKPRNAPGSWEADKQARFRQLTNTYARTLDQQGKYPEAFAKYQSVVNPDDVENSDPRTTERYFLCALRTNQATDALPMVEAAIQAGKATPSLKNTLRDWYAKQPGNDVVKAKAYLANLEADIKADQRDELLQKLINEPAPAFALTDLQGRTISSSSFKGKVIVLDFWATWCGPCIASFPAMQQAKNQFQDDPNVRFLFVNTREGGPLSRVHAFMEKHPYDFTVPIDGQQKVSKAYKVLGIPTKVVIGPNGRVRYRTIGYSGDPEATVNELALVVELLKEGK